MLERVGVLTDEVSEHLVEALDWVKANGLRHVEVRFVDGKNVADLSDTELADLRFEVEKRDLFVSCIASPLFKCALDPSREVASGDTFGQTEESVEAHFSKLDRVIDICKQLRTDKVRIFSFWREKDPSAYEEEIVQHLKRAAHVAEKADVYLLLENESACNGGYAVEVARIVRQINSPHVKVLWDPGNEVHGGRSAYPEGYQAVKGLIGQVHLKDAYVDEEGRGICVPIGEGKVPFAEQIQDLQKDGYTGLFTIETHYVPDGGNAMQGTDMTLAGIKKVAEAVGR